MAVDITTAKTAEVIGSIDDLLMQILLCLPVKSLMRFKLVSKHWKSLITSHRFSLVRYPSPNPAVGLICVGRDSTLFNYIHLGATKPTEPPFRELKFPGDPFSYWIQQSCNGLLLCCSFVNFGRLFCKYPTHSCCVFNPTTRCFAKLPPGFIDGVSRMVHGVNLAFDPSKSPVYKVVCVRDSKFDRDPPFQIDMYSSESGVWRVCGEPFSSEARFSHGVYWHGSIHWINYQRKKVLYFNVNDENIGEISLPATISGCGKSRRSIVYFGESCDHLHVIESCDVQMEFSVYEMKRDYSEWFVKYRVDLTMGATYFPETTSNHVANELVNLICSDSAFFETTDVNELENRTRYHYSVLCLVRGDEEEGRRPFLVLHASGKVIRFDLDYNTFEEIPGIGDVAVESWLPHAFEHIESLVAV